MDGVGGFHDSIVHTRWRRSVGRKIDRFGPLPINLHRVLHRALSRCLSLVERVQKIESTFISKCPTLPPRNHKVRNVSRTTPTSQSDVIQTTLNNRIPSGQGNRLRVFKTDFGSGTLFCRWSHTVFSDSWCKEVSST